MISPRVELEALLEEQRRAIRAYRATPEGLPASKEIAEMRLNHCEQKIRKLVDALAKRAGATTA